MMTKISVVIPVYNVEKYLRQCVDSMLAQTHPAWEIILIDDGSKDNSGTICDEYAAKHDRVIVVHKENQGLGMARNTGLEYVTGEYVIFIDSDDFCEPDFIEQLEKARKSNNCDTCKSCFDRVDLEGKFLTVQTIEPAVFRNKNVEKQLLARMIGSAPDCRDALPISACCTLYSMELIKAHGLQFVSERQWISEDMVFNIEYYHFAENVVLTDYVGYHYRTNPHSLSTTYMPDRFKRCLAMYHREVTLLSDMGIYDVCRFRLMRQFFVWLRMCFSQLKNSGMSAGEIKVEMKLMCDNDDVRRMISEYPVRKMGLKQQMFIYLIKFKQIGVLYLLFAR